MVVMHLAPEQDSGLPQVLEMFTDMPVIQVVGPTRIHADHVYVIPPNRQLIIDRNHVSVETFGEPRSVRMPIDHFFRSLAEEHGDGFGVLLSGGGTDGTVGIKAIKEKGGVLMAQDPEEAGFDSMPRTAIDTGLVDFVLPAAQLATELAAIASKKPKVERALDDIGVSEDAVLQVILAQLRARTGHDFTYYKQPTLIRRIARRMQVTRIDNLEDYRELLQNDPEEAHELFNELLIGVTSFFRDADVWDSLRENVLPAMFDDKGPGDVVRIWAVGCSTGEEAYSMAILAHEYAATLPNRPRVQIFASDIDERALRTAREGLYPDAIAADVSEERLARYFRREGQHYRVIEELRENVLFASHNVLREPPFSRLDLIICRNLLIYFQRNLQEYVFNVFRYALNPAGFLFLGTSEAIIDSRRFAALTKTDRIFQAKDAADEGLNLPLSPPVPIDIHSTKAPDHQENRGSSREAEMHHAILEGLAPPSVLVDERFRAVHLSESAGRYMQLSGGVISNDVTRLVRPELQDALHDALHRAFGRNGRVLTRSVPVSYDGSVHPVLIMVQPRTSDDGEARTALVVFIEGEADRETGDPDEHMEDVSRAELEEDMRQLRDRLRTLTEHSASTNRDLKAANEELQSMNEEYRSAIEELETIREELQSVNEELQTVNSELKNKLDEVSEAHGDLQNLLTATDIGTLFLDREMRIKRYTPRMRSLFNIMPADIGRPISDLAHRFEYGDLLDDARRVILDLSAVERELRGEDGRHYLVRVTPYRTLEDKIDGIVITLVDVTGRWTAEEALRKSEERYRILMSNVEEYAIFMMDLDLCITTWNSGSERILGYSEREAVGLSGDVIFTPEDVERGAPDEEARIARENGSAANERWHLRKDGSRFWGSGVMTALYDWNDELYGYAKVMRDNTDRKEAEDRLVKAKDELENRVRERTQEVRMLASRLTMAEQEERRRISQVLHDELQQLLYGIQMKMTFIKRSAESADQATLVEGADQAYRWLGDAIETTRRLTVDLSPPVLKGEGLADALRWLVSFMEDVYELKVELISNDSFPVIDEAVGALLFQVTRELMFNIVKHAGTREARVELEDAGDRLLIRVIDQGVGMRASAGENKTGRHGSGLTNARERIGLLGGSLQIESSENNGTRVIVSVPHSPKA